MIQRKGLSGTSIWSKTKPIREIKPMSLSEEELIIKLKKYKIIFIDDINNENN